jgi:hypothetical protein
MVVDLDDRRPHPRQVPRADGVVDANEVAHLKRGKRGGRANGVDQGGERASMASASALS